MHVFVSYPREDLAFATDLSAALESAGRKVWIDTRDIPPSAEWRKEVLGAVDAAHAFIFLLSPQALESSVCLDELAHAVAGQKRIIPILRAQVDAVGVPEPLAKRQWIACCAGDSVEKALAAVASAIDTDLGHARFHTRLQARAQEWLSRDRAAGFELHGEELREAEAWLAAHGTNPEPTALQREYVAASRHASKDVEDNRRKLEDHAEQQGRKVRALQLAGLSRSVRRRSRPDPVLGALLGIESVRHAQTDEGRTALLEAAAVLRRPSRSYRQNAVVRKVLLMPEGKLVTAGDDGVRLWSVASGEELLRLATGQRVADLAVSSDGRRITTASEAGDGSRAHTVAVWDANSGDVVGSLVHDGPVDVVAIASDGSWVVTGGSANEAVVWTPSSGRVLARLKHEQRIRTLVVGPRDDVIACVADHSCLVTIWSPRGDKIAQVCPGEGFASAISFQDAGRRLVVANRHALVEYDVEARHEQALPWKPLVTADRFRFDAHAERIAIAFKDRVSVCSSSDGSEHVQLAPFDAGVSDMAFAPQGSLMATGTVSGIVQVWDTSTGDEAFQCHTNGSVHGLTFSESGAFVICGSPGDHAAHLIEIQDAHLTARTVIRAPLASAIHSPDGSQLAVAAGVDPEVLQQLAGAIGYGVDPHAVRHQWNTGRFAYLTSGDSADHRLEIDDTISAMAFSQDGALLVVAGHDHEARIWDASTGGALARLRHRDVVTSAVFHAPGVLITGCHDKAAHVWDWQQEREISRLEHDGAVLKVYTHVDGVHVSTMDSKVLWRLWSGRNWQPLASVRHWLLEDLAVSPTANLVCTCDAERVAVWDVPGAREVARLGDPPASSVSFTSRGERIAVVKTNTVTLWDVARFEVRGEIACPNGLRMATVAPDARHVAILTTDGKVEVWNADLNVIVALLETEERATCVAFSPDGSRIAVGGERGTLRIEPWSASELVKLGCSRVHRELTDVERRRYVGIP
jgi:WD40 repeat protein